MDDYSKWVGKKVVCIDSPYADLEQGVEYTCTGYRANDTPIFLIKETSDWFKCCRFKLKEDKSPSPAESPKTPSEETQWTDKHYNFVYTLTEEDIARGSLKIDPYFVGKQWKIGSKDDSGTLVHNLKTIARFGEKNSREREIRALYAQIKRFAEIENVKLD